MNHFLVALGGLVFGVFTTHAAQAADFDRIMTEAQFRDQVVGKYMDNGEHDRVFEDNALVSSMRLPPATARDAPRNRTGRKRVPPQFNGYWEGEWSWSDGFLCLDRPVTIFPTLGPDCQVVLISGSEVLFISDKGKGAYSTPYTIK
ncbi:MAG: hypothetical protein AB8B47_11735 [Roseobacter sp.]